MSNSTADPDSTDYSDLLFYRAEYSSSLLSSSSYGLYLAFSGIAVYLLLVNGAVYAARRLTLAYTALMFVVTTTWYLAGARFSAFLFVDEAPGPEGVELTVKVCAMLQFLLSDSVILYRLYMSWNRNLRIMIFPAFLFLVCLVFGVLAELYCVSPWLEAYTDKLRVVFLSTTVALNAFATLAIAYKVLVIMRDASRFGPQTRGIEQRARTMLIVIIESGALYSIVGIVATVYYCNENSVAIVLGSMFQALSFVNPAFIILRVAMGISYEYEVAQTISQQPFVNDLEKALPPLPAALSQRTSMASFVSFDEMSNILVAKRVDLGFRSLKMGN